MNINILDLSEAEIVKPIVHKNNGSLRDVGNAILRDKRTKVYLINEFTFDNFNMAVVIVEYWLEIQGRYIREMLVVDKDSIKKIKKG